MRKIIFLTHVSLDGFVAGLNGEMDWIGYNDELAEYSYSLHATTDTAIYGRVTWQMMDGYWPTVLDNPAEAGGEIAHAEWYRDATKIVISTTVNDPHKKNTLFIGQNISEEINKLKQQSGKDMWLLGSPSVAQLFMQHNLIDEYRLNVNPVILGQGKPLFGGLENKLNLQLLEAKTFEGGVVGLRYVPG